ncbi:MAG: OsmC family protein [Kiloniellales bacterium]
MARDHHYEIALTWSGAAAGPTGDYKSYSREYRFSADGKPEQTGSADPAFRGDPALYNPEELLVAALSSCHMLSYLALCALQGIAVVAYEDSASGTMTETGGAGRFTEVVLRPRVTIARGGDLAKAEALHVKAHEICFIAASVNFPVRHEATLNEAA